MSVWLELAGSVVAILVMVGAAAALGFRRLAKLDAAELARLAAAEGAKVDAAAIDDAGRSALARLEDGRLLVARVMADGISARVAPQGQVRLRRGAREFSVTFGDAGFPPLKMRLASPPSWLSELGAVP
jgi:hypothetical protein